MKHAFTPCRECKALTQNANGLCDAHQHLGWERHQQHRAITGKAKGDYGAAWRKLRAQVLRRDDHLCQVCLGKDITRIATEVDHVVPREQGGSETISNLQSICRVCHREKTARERNATIEPRRLG